MDNRNYIINRLTAEQHVVMGLVTVESLFSLSTISGMAETPPGSGSGFLTEPIGQDVPPSSKPGVPPHRLLDVPGCVQLIVKLDPFSG